MVSSISAREEARAGQASASSPALEMPEPEVRALPKRRQFSAAYKLSVLEEADRANDFGAIGALATFMCWLIGPHAIARSEHTACNPTVCAIAQYSPSSPSAVSWPDLSTTINIPSKTLGEPSGSSTI